MKKLGLLLLFAFFGFGVQAQKTIHASINSACTAQPAGLAVLSGKVATGFTIKVLTAGNNCYSGVAFANKGFLIKAANGNVVYQYVKDAKGNVQETGGKLATLKLKSGNYYIWVDGGKGAELVLNYRI